MAKYFGEKKSGKVGDLIYSSWFGRTYTRRMPESVANPRTEAQQAHRKAFAEISRLSSAMKNGHTEGLHSYAVRNKVNTHSVFRKLNKDCYGPDGIDYARIKISKGPVSNVNITSATIDEQGNLHVEFCDPNLTENNMRDQLLVFVFCPDLREGRFSRPVARTVGVADGNIPEEWRGHELHLYAFMKDSKGKTSDTLYVNRVLAS